LEYCWWWGGLGNAFQLKTAINPKKEKKRKSVGLEFINSLSLASKTFRENLLSEFWKAFYRY
jgi:hypothetical protein